MPIKPNDVGISIFVTPDCLFTFIVIASSINIFLRSIIEALLGMDIVQ